MLVKQSRIENHNNYFVGRYSGLPRTCHCCVGRPIRFCLWIRLASIFFFVSLSLYLSLSLSVWLCVSFFHFFLLILPSVYFFLVLTYFYHCSAFVISSITCSILLFFAVINTTTLCVWFFCPTYISGGTKSFIESFLFSIVHLKKVMINVVIFCV